jgi:hypothetical protein
MPWCHNDRFTTPIYSQLDPWLPGRPDLTGGIFEGEPPVFDFDQLPRLLGERETDIYIDFSALKLPQQPIKIPVLRPIQISIDLQKIARPASDEKNPEVPKLPDLPDIPKIGKDKAESFIPSIEEDETPPTIRTFIPDLAEVDTNEISQILTAMKEILSGMDRAYDRFWSGVLQEGTEECQQIGAGPCVYTEMELIQTLTRLSDRPAVLLKDDFRSIGERRKPYEEVEGYAKCEREDWACQLLSGSESYPREGWHITESPIKEEKLDELFIELADEILKEKDEEDRFPYAVPLEKILPSYEVPGSFSILPKTEES